VKSIAINHVTSRLITFNMNVFKCVHTVYTHTFRNPGLKVCHVMFCLSNNKKKAIFRNLHVRSDLAIAINRFDSKLKFSP